MVAREINGFSWNGLFWNANVKFEGRTIKLGIRAKVDQAELVESLAPLASRFSEFWEQNRELIANEVRNVLSKDSPVDDPRPARCTLTTVSIYDSGWVLSQIIDKQGISFTYFDIYVSFEDSHGPVYGEGLMVKVVGRINDRLELDPKLRFDLVAF